MVRISSVERKILIDDVKNNSYYKGKAMTKEQIVKRLNEYIKMGVKIKFSKENVEFANLSFKKTPDDSYSELSYTICGYMTKSLIEFWVNKIQEDIDAVDDWNKNKGLYDYLRTNVFGAEK